MLSGARYLANIGLELIKLAFLARWSSPVQLRYVGEAPLTSITLNCNRLLAGHQPHDGCGMLCPGPWVIRCACLICARNSTR